MIPKVIHYCWFGGKELPFDAKKCIKSWKKFCPDYEIKKWDESNFDVMEHSFVKAAYEAKAWAFVSDYARLKVIYENGGIYLDTDVEMIRNPDFLLKNKCYIGVQANEHLCNTGLGFGAEKTSPVVRKMLDRYDSVTFDDENRVKFACPWLNDEVVRSYGYKNSSNITYLDELTVYPIRYFDPYPSGITENYMSTDTVSIHHYAATWTSGKIRIKRKLVRLFGEDISYQIKKIFRRSNSK